jgi:hypothetical protein
VTDGSRRTTAAAVERIRQEIADLERLMVDMPPHHAGGTRRGAEERLEDLRVALRRAVQRLDDAPADRSAP